MKGIINHSNYEDYFLMYVDEELGADEKKAVEFFVMQYPDLKPALEALLQTKIKADTAIVFPDKAGLLYNNSFVSDEAILLYLDGERIDEAIEAALQTPTPELLQRLDQFKKTISTPDRTLIFNNKSVLYKRAKLMRFNNRKIAAAAAILLLVAGYGLFKQPKDQTAAVAGGHLGTTGISHPVIDNRSASVYSEDAGAPPVQKQVVAKPALQKSFPVAVRKPASEAAQTTQPMVPVPGRADTESIPALAATREPGTNPVPPEKNINDQTDAILAKNSVVRESSVKEKKSLFKKLVKRIEDKVTDSFDEGDGQVTVAGFAFNVKQRK